jgi:hypothetical protein
MTTLVLSVTEASNILMTPESSFTIIIGMIQTRSLYYKHVMIVNDDSSVISN